MNQGRTCAAEVLLGSSLTRGRGRLASDYERIRSWRGNGRAIIAPAQKLLGITCHTLNAWWVCLDFANLLLEEATV